MQSNNKTISLSYRGRTAKTEAQSLQSSLVQNVPNCSCQLQELPAKGQNLGLSEVAIYLVLSSLGKAVLQTTVDHLEEYFEQRAEDSEPMDVQIVVKEDEVDIGKRFPFRLSNLKKFGFKAFFKTIREFIEKIP